MEVNLSVLEVPLSVSIRVCFEIELVDMSLPKPVSSNGVAAFLCVTQRKGLSGFILTSNSIAKTSTTAPPNSTDLTFLYVLFSAYIMLLEHTCQKFRAPLDNVCCTVKLKQHDAL